MPRVEFAGKKVTIQRSPSKARKLPSKYEINPHLARRKEISLPKTQIVESLNYFKLIFFINCPIVWNHIYFGETQQNSCPPRPLTYMFKGCFFGNLPTFPPGFRPPPTGCPGRMEPQAARPPPETNLEDLILMAGQPTPPSHVLPPQT